MRFQANGCPYELDELPGCTQVAVSHSSFVPIGQRGQGLGHAAHYARLAKMKELGFDCAICTVDAKNSAQIKILEKNGWSCVWGFDSTKTGHEVTIWIKNLV